MRPTYYEVLYYETYGELQRTKEKLDKMTGRWNRAVREVRKLRAELDKYRLQQVDEFRGPQIRRQIGDDTQRPY